MRKLFKYFNTVKRDLILTPILIIGEAFFEILIPINMGKLIDLGVKTNNQDLIMKYGLNMIIFAGIALIFGILATKTSANVSTEFGHNLREAQFKKIQEYSFDNIDNFKTSSLITRMTMDVNMIQMSANMILRVVFRAPGLLIFSIVSIALFAPSLTFVFIGIIPVLLIGLFFILKGAYKHFIKMFEKIDTLNLTIKESLIGIRTVKSFVREDYEVDKFTDATINVRENAIRAEKWAILNNPLMQFSIGLSFVLIGWFGSKLFVGGNLTEGEFANTITYINQILFSLMMISQVFLMLVISRASVRRINEVLDEIPTLVENSNPIEIIKDGSFEFKDVSFKYKNSKDNYIFKNLNLKIDSGSFVGIFGATGTGKSTLVQLLSRLYDVSDGAILVGGNDIRDYSLSSLRKEVILVLQKNVLFSGTIRDNIKWGKKDASDDEIINALKKAQAYDFIMEHKSGLDSYVEQGGVNFSGGQRQRLTIARALIANPKILILDDSTSAVDTKTDAKLKEAINDENKDMTKVVVSQRLSSIENADVIIILDDKGINSIGNHNSLYKENKTYKEIYDTQVKSKEVSEDE
ncbi:MAG: ABC transporter ATP-binding protein [Acholeplasmataceae bacterium]